jgi:hypothetical protein
MTRFILLMGLLLAAVCPASGSGLPNNPQLVLDLREGSWRMFMGWKTPTLVTNQGERKQLHGKPSRSNPKPGPVPVRKSWQPPKNWTAVDFDDTYWPRARGPVVVPQASRGGQIWNDGNATCWSLVCLRGSFIVKDPKRVALPRVFLRYYGGGIIYVNGKEIQRGHLPKGDINYDALATPYKLEQYCRPDGKLYIPGDRSNRDYYERFAGRVRPIPPKRWLDSVAIPKDLLRKGVNTIAIEVHAAPVNEAVVERSTAKRLKFGYQPWPHAGIVEARVVVGVPTGLVQNVAPEQGLHVSNEHPWETLFAYDYSHPQPSIRPISLFGPRNASFSGKLLVSSREDIVELKVTATELKHSDGKAKMPAPRIRFAEPANRRISHRSWPLFDRLVSKPAEEIRAIPMKIRGRNLQPVPTAAVPVWVTVDLPKDAAPGEYRGTVTVQDAYADPIKVPVQMTVCDWTLPETKDYRLNNCIHQSPDSVALFYKVERWSDKHFELIAESFRIADKMGSRLVPLSLVIDAPNYNNVESMVRWIKQADGSYKYDFTPVEKYLDCFEQAVGKPRIVVVYNGGFEGRDNSAEPPFVNTLDTKTGKLGKLQAPKYGTKEYTEFWRPVLHELRDRLKKRDWYDVAMIGHISYCWAPTRETAAAIQSIWPKGKWMSSCHGYRGNFGGLPVHVNEWIWGCGKHYSPDYQGSRGFPRHWRNRRKNGLRYYDHYIQREFDENNQISEHYGRPERQLFASLHGNGRLGADFWPVYDSRVKRVRHLTDTYAGLGIETTQIAMIAPGPDGPVWTERAEVWRTAVQHVETLAWVRDMLDTKKVPAELGKRAEALLLDRARNANQYALGGSNRNRGRISGGARERNDQLFAIAAEIASTLKKAK